MRLTTASFLLIVIVGTLCKTRGEQDANEVAHLGQAPIAAAIEKLTDVA